MIRLLGKPQTDYRFAHVQCDQFCFGQVVYGTIDVFPYQLVPLLADLIIEYVQRK